MQRIHPTLLALIGPAEIVLILVMMGIFGGAILLVVWLVARATRSGGSQSAPPRPPVSPPPRPEEPARPLTDPGTNPSGTPGVVDACPQCGMPRTPDAAGGLCPKCLLSVGVGTQPAAADAADPEAGSGFPEDPAEWARLFPQLEILEPIGRGGMGVVYRARQRKLDRDVALKLLPRAAAKDPAFAERFHREARALARLNHPNIVTVFDFGEVEGVFFLIMEYVDGADLRRVLQQGRLSPSEALRIVPVICDALQYAHGNGVVHRDIKPGNILLDREGRVKIADFGIAKLADPAASDITLTQSRQAMGTPHYMAPEQVENPQAVDHRADIYSLGVVFYEMLTGELPLGRFAPPSSRVRVDVRLDDVVLRALEKEPERRYQRAADVKTEVERLSVGNDDPAAPARGSGSGRTRPTGRGAWCLHDWTGNRKVVIGLVWAALFIVTLWVVIGGVRPGRSGLVGFLAVSLGLVGVFAPFGTTLFGLLGLRELIRDRAPRRAILVAAWASGLFTVAVGAAVVAGSLSWALTTASGPFALSALGPVVFVVTAIAYVPFVMWRARRVGAVLRGFLEAGSGHPGPGAWWRVGVPSLAVAIQIPVVAIGLLVFIRVMTPPSTPFGMPLPAIDGGTMVAPFPGEPLAWEMTAEGPALSEWFATGVLAAGPGQRRAIDDALRETHRQYERVLVEQICRRTTNLAGHVVIDVESRPHVLDRLEEEFWARVDPGLDATGQGNLRARLEFRPGSVTLPYLAGAGTPIPSVPSTAIPATALFPFGHRTLSFEFWRAGDWYHWRLHEAAKPGDNAAESIVAPTRRAPTLPAPLERLAKLTEAGIGAEPRVADPGASPAL